MARKPDIQYIGQFYIHGSEAKELARQEKTRKAKTELPLARAEHVHKIYVDPVAIFGIAVAVIMLAVMVVGAVQLRSAWSEYEQMSSYLNDLQRENAVLEHGYRASYDLEDIHIKAVAMGMVPASEVSVINVQVSVPVEEAQPTWWDDVIWFIDGLFE